jgi:deoxyribose-phosphate aldolase
MSELAKFLEYTILKPDTALNDVIWACEEAVRSGFASVCIPPPFVRDARRVLGERNKLRLATVVGYPMGYSAISAKSEEIKRALDDGADDINAALNITQVKSKFWNNVSRDIDGLALATQSRGGLLKLNLECNLLEQEELQKVCELAAESGVPWLQSNSGFGGHGPSVEMLQTLRLTAGTQVKIMAMLGSAHTAPIAQKLLDAGADRLGTSSGTVILGS